MDRLRHLLTPRSFGPAFRKTSCQAHLPDVATLKGVGPGELNHLSMGMSSDFEVAIEEGATLIRVGTALLGERPAGLAKKTL